MKRFDSALLLVTCAFLTACSQPSASEATSASAPKEIRSASTTQLNVEFQPQEQMLCVPTSASMVLKYYGDWEPPRKLKVLSRGHDYDPSAPFTDFTVTWYRDLVQAVGRLGYSWAERDFTDDDAGFIEGLSNIRSELLAGHPVLVDTSIPSGHTVVITGFNEQTQSLFLTDPSTLSPGQFSVSYSKFKDVWNEHAFNNHTRALVITSPHPKAV